MKKIILSLLFALLFIVSYAQSYNIIATEVAEDATTVTIEFKIVATMGSTFQLGGMTIYYSQLPIPRLDIANILPVDIVAGQLTKTVYDEFMKVVDFGNGDFSITLDYNTGTFATIDATGKTMGRIKFNKLGGSNNVDLIINPASVVSNETLAPPGVTLDDAIVSTIVLPLEWLSFKATPITADGANKVALTWETASEKDVINFNVERSDDGKVFTKIGAAIPANNKVSKSSYTAYDDKPLNGVSYYRIRQTDVDGKTTVTKIESVTLNSKKAVGKFTFYPKPIQKGTPLSILTDVQGVYDFKVIDMTGKVMYNQKLQGNNIELKGLSLAAGTYLYEILSGEQRMSGKIFVAE